MIKNVFLDVDDTLLDFKAGQKEAFFQACDELGYKVNEEIYELYDGINIFYWEKFERGEIAKHALLTARFDMLFEKTGINGDSRDMENAYRKYLKDKAIWIDGAEDGLKYLANKYNVYVLTNGESVTQKNRVKISGIENYVKDIFVSEAVGYPKPQKEYYDYCFLKSGAKAAETIAIGDSLTSDILGGKNAGTKTLWFNFRGLSPNEKVKPDYEVRTWKEIKEIL